MTDRSLEVTPKIPVDMTNFNESCSTRWEMIKQRLNNVPPGDFVSFCLRPDVIVADVRTRGEFDHAHVKGAMHLDYLAEGLIDKLEKLDPTLTYLVYCKTGRRSLRVCTLMDNLGFKDAWHLDGGTNILYQQKIDLSKLEIES